MGGHPPCTHTTYLIYLIILMKGVSAVRESETKEKQRGVYVHTFGCQMNVHDSQKILTLLSKEGYAPVKQPEDADVILLNTCSVREKPEQKVMSAVGRYAQLKRKNPELLIGIGGCFARQEGPKLLKRAPVLDLVFGPDNIPELPQMLGKLHEETSSLVDIDFDPAEDVRFLDIAPQVLDSSTSAMVTIMKGCDKYCSFCIVPYVRGRERYRSGHEIIEEARKLCKSGVREVLLLGQSVTSYAWQDEETGEVWKLSTLLKEIDKVEGLDRLRFTSPYPRDFTPDLVNCFGALPTLCEYVHLPFQSGSNQILYRMNRRHTREQYFEWVDALRERVPEIALSADVIVGFPGETDADFDDTMDLIERVRFDGLFSFMYSPRPYTPAARKAQVDERVSHTRLLKLQERQREIMLEKNEALVDSIQEVLIEGLSKKDGELRGRTRGNKVVNFVGDPNLIGELVTVKILNGYAHSLRGELV
ncbi:MAG: tRNA (N6-isopentenyl adenosine(37)-C2)-methylthiotransferase MiaB [Deltaproteobacteria bacterium]|nr:tRNA (N6-isopentenyl adenosine(37)-C2)-methylthiotransferase MiaB [Deltaproteobacteria bacterium]MBU49492.1 tRNA (N6-isopentenyl adenosine(37)-C2)-methylthiotransferase MiaB [Deltaproteobacteria bacterium]